MTKIVVREVQIVDGRKAYTAWERQDGVACGHSTITTIDGVWFGRIGTRRLPAHLEALPAMTEERLEAVREWQRGEYAEAYDLIYAEHPWLLKLAHYESMGEVSA